MAGPTALVITSYTSATAITLPLATSATAEPRTNLNTDGSGNGISNALLISGAVVATLVFIAAIPTCIN